MDKHEAKFILTNFRPDGADAGSPDFAEALRLAAADRDLGEWLAAERALDADFARALARVELPDDLRGAIESALAAERGEEPERDGVDVAFAGALAGLAPPPGLRAEVLLAMERSAPRRFGWKLAVPLAAAAGIALAVGLPRLGTSPSAPPAIGGAVPVAHVEAAAIDALTSPAFQLDLKNSDHEELFRFIREKGSPCPQGCIPRGLREVPGIGCRNLRVDGKPGALICFLRGANDVVHLVVFRDEDVGCLGPCEGKPRIEQHGDWAVARWSEKGRVFLLLGTSGTDKLGELF